MSVPQYCWDVSRSGMQCRCLAPPPEFVSVLPPMPTTSSTADKPAFTTSPSEPLTIRTDTSSNGLPDPKLFGTLIGIFILLLVLAFLGFRFYRKRRAQSNGDETGPGPGRAKLKLSPSSSSQKPLIHTSSAVSENPKLAKPLQPNGESEKMMESNEKPENINTSFTGGNEVIPMIDDEEEEDDDTVIARIMFNESNC